jgi:tetratricopeptide (TPR) repeat protein
MRVLPGWPIAAFLAFAVPQSASAEWREVETAHFRIISESDPAAVEELAARLESYDKLMRMANGIAEDNPVKVRIYEVAGTGEIEKALDLHNSGVAGFYDSNSLGAFAVTPRKVRGGGRYFTPLLVLQHEYAHHFMLQYFPAIYPSWYVEGFAELIGSSKTLDDGRIGYGMPALHRGNEINAYWVPLQELLTREKVVYVDTYAQGWALTHFLTFDKKRSGQLRQYLAALGRGKSLDQAAAAFGDLEDLNREARRYVTAGSFEYRPVKVEIARPVVQRSRVLSAGEAALIPETIAYRDSDLSAIRKDSDRKDELGDRQRNLAKIREKAGQFANDPFALQLLSEVEFSLDNFQQSEAAVDRLLALRPSDRDGMVRKSILMSRRAGTIAGPDRTEEVKKARALAVRANRADPNDPDPLLAFYQSYNLTGERPTKAAIDGLMQAVSLLPRNSEVRQLLVDQLARDRRYDEAMGWLMPVANSPHKSPRREAARRQMEQLKAAKAAAGQKPDPTG